MIGKTAVRPSEAAAAWAWLLQRVSAAFLLFFVGAHLWVLHFVLGSEKITFERVKERLQQPFFQVLDLVLMAIALYHALYGLRGIVLDLGVTGAGRQALTWGLLALGVGAYIYGVLAFLAFF